MKKYKCNCENIAIGSYDNQVALQAPIWSQKNRISVDSCLSSEIRYLWLCGVRTTGCCCGHNQLEPYIGVEPKSVNIMQKLGYELCEDDLSSSTHGLNFIPRSIKQISNGDNTNIKGQSIQRED